MVNPLCVILANPFTWIFLCLSIAVYVIQTLIARGTARNNMLAGTWKYLGVDKLPAWLRWPLSALWLLLFGVFVWGILWVFFYLLMHAPWFSIQDGKTAIELRWFLLTLTAMTTTLGATIAFPFTLIRNRKLNRQTDATEQGLVTDRLNKAVEGLGAQKEVNKLGRNVSWALKGAKEAHFEWKHAPLSIPDDAVNVDYDSWSNVGLTEPNLEVRIGSIYALERIAKENKAYHVQVMEILCAYIRENAPAEEAEPWPKLEMRESETNGPLEADFDERMKTFREESDALKERVKPRSDIQTALTVIGRRSAEQRQWEAEAGGGQEGDIFPFDVPCPTYEHHGDGPLGFEWEGFKEALNNWKKTLRDYQGYRLDLRTTNLQGADMSSLNYAGAKLDNAHMQGADLYGAQMQGADLYGAQMQGAYVYSAQMQGADLDSAQMQGADLGGAQMQGAFVYSAQMQGANLLSAQMQGAYLDSAQMQGAFLDSAQMQGAIFPLSRAALRGARLRAVDCTNIADLRAHVPLCFGDGSVTLPEDWPWPDHWPDFELDIMSYDEEWREWLKDPDAYTPPKTPE